ncbi:hypothetical protein BCR34DRAFT_201678 [Clohesyomyces aquaticus]|uniref:Uncharacterized protein n=1 Tax=Clohesyomyces aquaticus TaxID=1231657 RepID=A0A1Y1ZXB5_9PLEO|nr:hypothetical protein BCR34DRAFT_201678 [Clohesyomyces aquaticus]
MNWVARHQSTATASNIAPIAPRARGLCLCQYGAATLDTSASGSARLAGRWWTAGQMAAHLSWHLSRLAVCEQTIFSGRFGSWAKSPRVPICRRGDAPSTGADRCRRAWARGRGEDDGEGTASGRLCGPRPGRPGAGAANAVDPQAKCTSQLRGPRTPPADMARMAMVVMMMDYGHHPCASLGGRARNIARALQQGSRPADQEAPACVRGPQRHPLVYPALCCPPRLPTSPQVHSQAWTLPHPKQSSCSSPVQPSSQAQAAKRFVFVLLLAHALRRFLLTESSRGTPSLSLQEPLPTFMHACARPTAARSLSPGTRPSTQMLALRPAALNI